MRIGNESGITVGELIKMLQQFPKDKFVSMASEEYWATSLTDKYWGVDIDGPASYPDRVESMMDETVK